MGKENGKYNTNSFAVTYDDKGEKGLPYGHWETGRIIILMQFLCLDRENIVKYGRLRTLRNNLPVIHGKINRRKKADKIIEFPTTNDLKNLLERSLISVIHFLNCKLA